MLKLIAFAIDVNGNQQRFPILKMENGKKMYIILLTIVNFCIFNNGIVRIISSRMNSTGYESLIH